MYVEIIKEYSNCETRLDLGHSKSWKVTDGGQLLE